MFKYLRNRLVLSHTLPFLVIIPLMGIVMIYLLENQYLRPNLTKNLKDDAVLIADIARDHPDIWSNVTIANNFLGRISPGQIERVILITRNGVLMGSTDPSDLPHIEEIVKIPGFSEVLKGNVITNDRYSQEYNGEVIDIIAPVIGNGGDVEGIVGLTYRYAAFFEEFLQIRYFIGTILLVSLLFGIGLGSFLAVNIGNPIRNVTQAVNDLATGKSSEQLLEGGPEEVRQLQRAANHLFTRLQNLEDSRRKLLANLVHELGRPLGALIAAIQALRRGAKENPALLEELLVGMESEASILKRVTEDLSHLHGQEVGPLELEYQVIQLSDWLPGFLRAFGASAQESRLEWETIIPDGMPAVWIDPGRVSQALGNLIGNALKYTGAGGKINVTAGVKGREVWIQVGDSGPGIPFDEQEMIFTPFYRGGHGRRFPQGMGLGLSIARDLVLAHGGRIELDSAPGLGSKFTIWLPISEDEKR